MKPRLRALVRTFDPGGPRWLTIPAVLLVIGLAIFQATTATALIFGEHDWRQADTFSVVYWLRHESADFFHPRIDWGSEHSGVMGMEAPIFPYAVYLLSFVFGLEPLVGRFLNWAIFWPILFIFARRFAATRSGTAIMLLAFATSPMCLYEFREVQPDPFMTSLLMAAAVAFDRSTHGSTKRVRQALVVGYGLTLLAVLSKVPAVVAFPALWVLAVKPGTWRTRRTLYLGAGFLGPLAVAVLWDRWAHHLNVLYNGGQAYFHIDFSAKLIWKSLTKASAERGLFTREVPGYVTSWVWTPAFLAGIPAAFLMEPKRRPLAMVAWLLSSLFFCACFCDRIVAHWYYGLVVLVPVSYFVAKGLENVIRLWNPRAESTWIQRALAWAVIFAMLISPLIGGALKSGKQVVGAAGLAVKWATWMSGTSPIWLALVIAAGFLFARFLARASASRVVIVGAMGVALVLGSARAARDSLEAMKYRAKLGERTKTEASIRKLQSTADRLIPMNAKVLVDQHNPAFLRRVRRHGFAESEKTINDKKKTLKWYQKHGAQFLVHFGKGNGPSGAGQPIVAYADWKLYCLLPKGCSGIHGPAIGPRVERKPRPPPAAPAASSPSEAAAPSEAAPAPSAPVSPPPPSSADGGAKP